MPSVNPVTVVDVPDPVDVLPPGYWVNVHVPVAGNPDKNTDPVDSVQVGCVMVPIVNGETLVTVTAVAALVAGFEPAVKQLVKLEVIRHEIFPATEGL